MIKNKLNRMKINVTACILFIILISYSFSLIAVISWGLITSLKSEGDFVINKFALPQKWQFNNYIIAFKNISFKLFITGKGYYKVNLLEMLFNSLLFSVGCSFFGVIAPCIVAYITAKYSKWFNAVIDAIVIFTMIVPIIGNLPSMLQVLKFLGLYNKIYGVWLMKFNFLGLYYLVFNGVFKSISWEYAEAAIIDGESHLGIMTKIMFPLAKNTISVVFILLFISYWNDYQTPLIYVPSMPTAAYGLYNYTAGYGENIIQSVPLQLAGGMIILLPIIILFLSLQNKIMGNISVGGLKG